MLDSNFKRNGGWSGWRGKGEGLEDQGERDQEKEKGKGVKGVRRGRPRQPLRSRDQRLLLRILKERRRVMKW